MEEEEGSSRAHTHTHTHSGNRRAGEREGRPHFFSPTVKSARAGRGPSCMKSNPTPNKNFTISRG